ncbi:MAG: PD-(D/E)XK nuclease family protein [Methanosarcinales archaeon]
MLSKSKIDTYEQCPRKFKYAIIDKIPPKPPSPALILGRSVHEIAENIWKEGLLKVNGDKITLDLEPSDNPTLNRHIHNLMRLERKRWELCKIKSMPKKYFFPRLVEEKIENEKLQINGIVDRVDRELDDSYSIIEIKTGKVHEFKNYKFELKFYKYLLMSKKILDNKIKRGVVIFTKTGEVKVGKLGSLGWVKRKINKVRRKIKEERFERNITTLCNYCDYKKLCLKRFGK